MDVGELKQDVGTRKGDMGEVKTRLTSLESIVRKMRRDNAGMLVMMRATTGDVDERVSEPEDLMELLTRPKD